MPIHALSAGKIGGECNLKCRTKVCYCCEALAKEWALTGCVPTATTLQTFYAQTATHGNENIHHVSAPHPNAISLLRSYSSFQTLVSARSKCSSCERQHHRPQRLACIRIKLRCFPFRTESARTLCLRIPRMQCLRREQVDTLKQPAS